MEQEQSLRRQRWDEGFFIPEVHREYFPVKLNVRFLKTTIGSNPFSYPEDIFFEPSDTYKPMLCLAGRNLDNEHTLFVKRPEDDCAREVMNLENVRVLFDADIFFELMLKASTKNKMVFFSVAELPDRKEMDRFLEMVKHRSMTEKDRHRAQTWVLKLASRQRLFW